MNKKKTRRVKPHLLVFLLLSSLFCNQALAKTWDVAVLGSYSTHGVLGYGLGLRIGTHPVAGLYLGARFQAFPFSDETARVPCECIPSRHAPGYELVKTLKQIYFGGLESGLEMRIGKVTLKPALLLGLALPHIEAAFPSPVDGPAIVTTENDVRWMTSPGLVISVPVSSASLALEIYYHNIVPFDSGSDAIRALATGLSLGFSL